MLHGSCTCSCLACLLTQLHLRMSLRHRPPGDWLQPTHIHRHHAACASVASECCMCTDQHAARGCCCLSVSIISSATIDHKAQKMQTLFDAIHWLMHDWCCMGIFRNVKLNWSGRIHQAHRLGQQQQQQQQQPEKYRYYPRIPRKDQRGRGLIRGYSLHKNGRFVIKLSKDVSDPLAACPPVLGGCMLSLWRWLRLSCNWTKCMLQQHAIMPA